MASGLLRRPSRGRAHWRALVLAGFGLLSVAAPAAAQLTVDQLELHVDPARNRASAVQVLPVRNELDRPQQVRVVLMDWQRDSLGRNQFLPAGTHERSCGARLQVFPMTFQVAAKSEESVRISYDPAGNPEGCWSIVMFEAVQPPAQNSQAGSFVTIEVRTGVKVYVHPDAPVREGTITFADVVQAWVPRQVPPGAPRDSALAWQADLRFVSAGNEHLKLRTTVEIRDLEGRLRHTVTAPEGYLTPRAVRDQRVTLPALAAGDYVALLMVDYGGDEIAAAQVEFKVP